MTEITRAYELSIYQPGSTTTAEFTFQNADFAAIPEYSTWIVDPLEGRVQSVPFEASILDTSDQITSNLADANGRGDMIGRFWRLRVNEDAAGPEIVAMGRVTGVRMDPQLGSYTFMLGDELYFMRQHEVFTDVGATPTTQIWPPGLRSEWSPRQANGTIVPFKAAPEAQMLVFSTDASRSDSLNAVLLVAQLGDAYAVPPKVVEWLKNDLLPDRQPGPTSSATGHFDKLRLRTSSTDYEVLSFSGERNDPDLLGTLDDQDSNGARYVWYIWVAWATSQPTVDTFIDCVLYAPNAPASEAVPYHVGGASGVDKYTWLETELTNAGVRYDANVFAAWDRNSNPQGLQSNPTIPPGWIRATGKMRLLDVVQRMCKEDGLAPFQNASGELALRSVMLPRGADIGALTTVQAAGITAGGHPTWHQRGNQIKTVYQGIGEVFEQQPVRDATTDLGADRIAARKFDLPEIEHDRVANLGRHVHRVEYFASRRSTFRQQQATELFDRYGDGPVTGVLGGMRATDTIDPGDHVILNLASYPNMADQARGGNRLIQILRKEHTPRGSRMEYIDAGAASNQFTPPAVAIALNGTRGEHDVDVTISGLPTTAAGYQLQLRVASGAWETVKEGTTNETVTLTGFPSNTLIEARAASIGPNNIRSQWSGAENRLLQSEDLGTTWTGNGTQTLTTNASVAPDGSTTADNLEDTDAATPSDRRQSITVPNDSATYCISVFVSKLAFSGNADIARLAANLTGGTARSGSIDLDTNDGATQLGAAQEIAGGAEDYGDYWRLWFTMANDSSGNTTLQVRLTPAWTDALGNPVDNTLLGDKDFWGAQVEADVGPGGYVLTTTTAVTQYPQVTTTALTAPSAVTATIDGRGASWTWTNGETLYGVMPTLDGVDLLSKPLRAGSTQWAVTGLDASTSYTFGVKHVDPYGGESAIGSDTETTGTANTLIVPGGLMGRLHDPSSGDVVYPDDNFLGTGLELGIARTEPHAKVEIQVDTASGFTGPDSYFLTEGQDIARIHLPNDGTLRYVRARHIRTGYTESDWTATFERTPAPFARTPPSGLIDVVEDDIIIPAQAFVPQVDNQNWAFEDSGASQAGYVQPNTTGATQSFHAPVVLPLGVVVTRVDSRVYRNAVGDTATAIFRRVSETGTITAVASLTPTGTGWEDVQSATITEEVTSPNIYLFTLNLQATTTEDDARLLYVRVRYRRKNVRELL